MTQHSDAVIVRHMLNVADLKQTHVLLFCTDVSLVAVTDLRCEHFKWDGWFVMFPEGFKGCMKLLS